MYFLYICFYLCTGVFYFSPVSGGRFQVRLGIVSLFTCVTTVFLLKNTKTNLVPSFLPALSGSTCIISLANHYNTSVDAAIVQRLWRDYQVECLKECRGEFAKSVVLISEFCCVHGWLLSSTSFHLPRKNLHFSHVRHCNKGILALMNV